MKKSRMIMAGLAALAAVSMIGGTWAVWSQTLWAYNEFKTAKYSTFLEEKFEPPEEWQPGITEQKEVWVRNESTIPVVAKISINQEWFRREDITAWVQEEEGAQPVEKIVAHKYDPTKNNQEGRPSLSFEDDNGYRQFAAILNLNREKVFALENERNPEEGLRLKIDSVSSLEEAAQRKAWLLLSETPDEEGNYTFYYMGLVEPGESTPVLLSSVTMNPLLENTVTGSESWYVKDDTAEDGYRLMTREVVNSKYGGNGGYEGCTYEMNVNMQTVQATSDAVESIFPGDPFSQYISGYIAGDLGYDSSESPAKRLFFEESNGIITYRPDDRTAEDGEPGNWFMSFTNMVPGGKYADSLLIENNSRKNYMVYMSIVPRGRTEQWDQTELRNELLKRIGMKVFYGDNENPIYQGDATGFHYSAENGETDMQGLVPLGYFDGGRKETIRVELMLDPEIGLQDDGTYKYADLLTKIDWVFMVQEQETPNRPNGGGSPGGGGGRPDRDRNPSDPATPIGDEPTPLGPGEGGPDSPDDSVFIDDDGVPLVTLPEPDVPLTSMIPKTGDDFPWIPVMVTAAASLMLIMVLGVLRGLEKRKNQ